MPRLKPIIHSGLIVMLAGGVYLALIAGFTAYSAHTGKHHSLKEIDRSLLHSVKTIPQLLAENFAERAVRADGISEEEDRKNITRLTRMANALDLAYLYTLFYQDGQVYITSSSASEAEVDSHEEVRYFTPYPEGLPFAQEAVQSGQPVFNSYTDRWGTFRHVYIPLKTAGGQDYLLCADQEVGWIQAVWHEHIHEHILIGLTFSLLAGVLFLLTYYLVRKNTVRQLKETELALQHSNEMLQKAEKIANEGCFEWDLKSDQWSFSEQWLCIHGVDEPPIRKDELLPLAHPDDRKRITVAFQDAVEGIAPYCIEHRIIRKSDGAIRYIYAQGEIVYDDKGEAIKMYGIARDITERQEVEENLIQSEAKKNKMISNIGDVIVIIDSDGINRYKSPNIEKLFGWKPEEVVGKPALDLVHPDDVDKASQFLGRLMETPGVPKTTEVRYRHKNGNYRWIRFTATNLVNDPDINGILGNYHDVTGRKETEEKLKENEQQFREIIDTSPFPVAVADQADKKILFWSQKAVDILGFDPPPATTEKWYALAYPDPAYREEVLNQWKPATEKALQAGVSTSTGEYRMMCADGKERVFELYAHFMENLLIVSFNDLTERKLGEEAMKEQNDELRRFNKAAVGRELRMAELKKEINTLCRELGREEPYALFSGVDSNPEEPNA